MHPDILMLFNKTPDALPLYAAAEAAILNAFPQAHSKVGKTQVSFYNRHLFAALWPPVRKRKDWPTVFVGVTFGLGYRLEHPRIVQAVEPYPNRWTHHVLLTQPGELDEQLLGWLREAHDFALLK